MLTMHPTLGSFCCVFMVNCVIYVIIYASFLAIYLGMVLFCVLQVLGPFHPCFDPSSVYFDSLRIPLSCHAHGKEKRTEECRSRAYHRPTMVMAMVCGRPPSSGSLCFVTVVRLPGSYYSM